MSAHSPSNQFKASRTHHRGSTLTGFASSSPLILMTYCRKGTEEELKCARCSLKLCKLLLRVSNCLGAVGVNDGWRGGEHKRLSVQVRAQVPCLPLLSSESSRRYQSCFNFRSRHSPRICREDGLVHDETYPASANERLRSDPTDDSFGHFLHI